MEINNEKKLKEKKEKGEEKKEKPLIFKKDEVKSDELIIEIENQKGEVIERLVFKT